MSVAWSLLAPASISKDTHLRLPLRDAAHKGVIASASSKFGISWLVQMPLKKLVIIFLTCDHDALILLPVRQLKLQDHKLYNLKGKCSDRRSRFDRHPVRSCHEGGVVGSVGCQSSVPSAVLRPSLNLLKSPLLQKPQLIHRSLRKATSSMGQLYKKGP